MIVEHAKVVSKLEKAVENFKASNGLLRAHIILTGPSGSGKSHIVSHLAAKFQLNPLEINAAQLTKEGMSGNSLAKALSPLINHKGKLTIVFVDEFDKLFISGNSNSDLAHEVTNGVQNEFLKVLESATTDVFGDYGKYIKADVSKCLFVFAGAFNGEENITIDKLRDYGLKTEFLGRVPLIVEMQKLSLESLWSILVKSDLLAKYCELYGIEDTLPVAKTIMRFVQKHYENNTLGIRILNNLIHLYFVKNGNLDDDEVASITFSKKLSMEQSEEVIDFTVNSGYAE